MTDIHCHILHEMDDGPADIATALRLCETALNNGIDKIIATPHLTAPEDIDAFIRLRDEKLTELRAAMDRIGVPLEFYPGAEVLLTDTIFYAGPLHKATLNGSRYLLVEFEFFGVGFASVMKYLDEIFKMDLVPVIAHPERYSFFQRDYERVNYLYERGARFQLNAGSLAGFGSREEYDLAHEFAYRKAASFIGTDAHSVRNRPNDLLALLRHFPSDISQSALDYMLNLAPAAVIKDEPLPDIDAAMLKNRRR